MKIIGVYKITNTATGDFYIGSSKNIKHRWANHKCPSKWNEHPNNPMYLDMKKYGVEKFDFEILAEVEPGQLKEKEQQFIEKMHPTYNSIRANGWDFERRKKYMKEYMKSETLKKYKKEYNKKYQNQPCLYNGEKLTFNTLTIRFRRAGIENPTIEAKKYIIKKESKTPIEFYDVYP